MAIGTCTNYIYEAAYTLWGDLGSPTATSVAYISGWFTAPSNLGKLNDAINTCYGTGSGVGTVTPTIENEELAIYAQLYKVNYYERASLATLVGGAASPWTSLTDDVSKITKTSLAEYAKVYLNLKKEAMKDLTDMISRYQVYHATVGTIDMGVPWEGPTPVPAYVNNDNRANNYYE